MPLINGLQVLSGNAVGFRTDVPAAGVPRRAGWPYSRITEVLVTPAAPDANSVVVSGIALSQAGALHIFDATAGLPAGAVLVNGIALTSQGAMCVAPNPAAVYVKGWPVDMLGRVCVAPPLNLPGAFTFNVPVPGPTIVGLSWTPSTYAAGFQIFRDAVLVKELPGDTLSSFDEPPGAGTYTYSILAVNEVGTTASTPPSHSVVFPA